MAGDSSLEIQAALYTRLTTDPGVNALVANRVFDHVPQNSAFPYLTIGDETWTDWSMAGVRGQSSTVSIHTWSRPASDQPRGRHEAKQIMEAVYEALHGKPMVLEGHRMVMIRQEYSETLPDTDNVTYHGIQRFRVLTHEQGA
jgi:hypothetical protein